jgi:hypothetical protein
MATMPYPANTDIAVQNNMTGEVDYLNFNGSQLVASDAVTYAGAGWNVVAQGSFGGPAGHDLVLQNNLSNVVGFLGVGFLDFLKLDANGKLVTSAMSNFAIFPVVGQGFFNSAYPGQLGPTLVSQLPDGELDMLGYDASGTLIHSDLVSNSIGLPPVVGVGEADTGEGPTHYSLFAGTGTGANDSIVTQLPMDRSTISAFREISPPRRSRLPTVCCFREAPEWRRCRPSTRKSGAPSVTRASSAVRSGLQMSRACSSSRNSLTARSTTFMRIPAMPMPPMRAPSTPRTN